MGGGVCVGENGGVGGWVGWSVRGRGGGAEGLRGVVGWGVGWLIGFGGANAGVWATSSTVSPPTR